MAGLERFSSDVGHRKHTIAYSCSVSENVYVRGG